MEVTVGLLDKIKGMLGQHKDQAKGAVEKAGDAVDDKTGDKYSSQVDTAQAKADEFIDKTNDQA
jgi:hypothetical protein